LDQKTTTCSRVAVEEDQICRGREIHAAAVEWERLFAEVQMLAV
jgi:hypothetical protein